MVTRITIPKSGAGQHLGGPAKFVMHTTETWGDPRSWIPGWSSASHEVWDYERDLVITCVQDEGASKALWTDGSIATNRDGAWQVEVNGLAVSHTAGREDWSEAKYRWMAARIAETVMRLDAKGLGKINLRNRAPVGVYGGSAFENAPQRLSKSAWDNFDGFCGHRNVPMNSDRWDPGIISYDRLCDYALEIIEGTLAPAEPLLPPDEDDMKFDIRVNNEGTPWAFPWNVQGVNFASGAGAQDAVCRKGDVITVNLNGVNPDGVLDVAVLENDGTQHMLKVAFGKPATHVVKVAGWTTLLTHAGRITSITGERRSAV